MSNATAPKFLLYKSEKDETQAFLITKLLEGSDEWNKWRANNPSQSIDFSGIDFSQHNLSFENCNFGSNANFMCTKFGEHTSFQSAIFGDNTNFVKANFGSNTSFLYAKFGDSTNFMDASFGSNTSFNDVVFGKLSVFKDVTFGCATEFIRASFDEDANFISSTFGVKTDFTHASFEFTQFNEASFAGDTFFMHAKFRGYSSFDRMKLKSNFNIARAEFLEVPSFEGVENAKCIRLNHATFRLNSGLVQWTGKESVIRRLQSLRGVADINHATNEVRDLFILERQAERGILWAGWRENKLSISKLRQALQSTILLFFYWLLADFGRSVFRPIFAFYGVNYGFYFLYQKLYEGILFVNVKSALQDYTITNSIPFGRLLNPAFEQSLKTLFEVATIDKSGTIISRYFDISMTYQLTGIAQSIVSGVLIFLTALGIRNYFRIDVTG